MPYVALGNFATGSFQIESSSDGSMWAGSTHPLTKGGFALAFGNNRFVAVGFAADGVTSIALVSTDGGATWASHSVPQPFGVEYHSMTYSTSLALFVAMDSGNGISANVITSPDGNTWTLSATIAQGADTAFYEGITSGGTSVLVAVGDDSATHKVVATSPDAVTWTKRLGAGTGKDWNSVVFGGGQYVAVTGVSADHQVMTSSDGITWSLQVTPTPRQFWHSVTVGTVGASTLYVAVGGHPTAPVTPQIMTSPDGVTWTMQTPPAGTGNLNLMAVAFFNGLFFAVGFGSGGKNIITSPDGITWTLQASAIPDNLQATAGALVTSPPPSTAGGLGFVGSGVATGGSVLGSTIKPCRTTEIDWAIFSRIIDAMRPDDTEEVDYPGRPR